MKCWFQSGNRVGIFLALLFAASFLWYWLHPVNQDLHLRILEILFYGYKGMTLPGFFLGVIQSYVWGYIGVALWRLAHVGCECNGKKKSKK